MLVRPSSVVRRYCGEAAFRVLSAEEKDSTGRTLEVTAEGRVARAVVRRVFVSRVEGPDHDAALAVLGDPDAPDGPERTVRVGELLRAAASAPNVRWVDDDGAVASDDPPAKRRRGAAPAASSPLAAEIAAAV